MLSVLISGEVKTQGLTHEILLKRIDLRGGEESGIPSVAVECVEIGRKSSGEGDVLDWK